MGWSGANEIFDPMAMIVTESVDLGQMPKEQGVMLLAQLAQLLVDGDWDTYEESLEASENHPVVVAAFKDACGVDVCGVTRDHQIDPGEVECKECGTEVTT